jgi:hypothetical protein
VNESHDHGGGPLFYSNLIFVQCGTSFRISFSPLKLIKIQVMIAKLSDKLPI